MLTKVLRRYTLWLALSPRRFIDTSYNWEGFDIEKWSDIDYDWEQDEKNGVYDYVSKPETTIRTGKGDCEDYALVAASYLYNTTEHDLDLGIHYRLDVGRSGISTAGHVTLYDATENMLYSSGSIRSETPEEHTERTDYKWTFRRSIQ